MLPEIYLRIGEAEVLRGNVVAAVEAFQKSAELKPDYWPAYARKVDLLLKLKRTADAKATAIEGLRYSPKSAELAQRVRKLGGDPTNIVPAQAASAAELPKVEPAPDESASAPASSGTSARAGTLTR